MNAFEICLVALALIAAGLGGHATGYARGRRTRPRYRRSASYEVHCPNGLYMHTPDRAAAEAFAAKYGGGVERESPAPLPRKITQAMPIVPVSVDGDEVRRPE